MNTQQLKAITTVFGQLVPEDFDQCIEKLKEVNPTFHAYMLTPKVKSDRKDKASYQGVRAMVKSEKVTPKEGPLLAQLLKGEQTVRGLAAICSVSTNLVNGALSMLLAKEYVETERKSVDGGKVDRWVTITEKGKTAYAAWDHEQKNPKPKVVPTKKDKPNKPLDETNHPVPTWTETSKISITGPWDLSTETVDNLDKFTVNENEQTLSEIWNSLSKDAQDELNKEYAHSLV